MALTINPLAVGGGRISQTGGISRSHGRMYGAKVLSAPNAPIRQLVEYDEESREEFIERMKLEPDLWGVRGKKSEIVLSAGRVYIFKRNGEIARSIPFLSKKSRSEVVALSLKEIEHLKGYYIEIQFYYDK